MMGGTASGAATASPSPQPSIGADGKIPLPGAKVPSAAEIAAAKESYRYCACPEETDLVCGGVKKDGKTLEQPQTFPNECIAKCAGVAWVTAGACHEGQ